MNELLYAAVLDGGWSHWPDLLLTAFIAFAVWLLERGISRMEKRHERAETKFEVHGQKIAEHHTRLSLLEEFKQSLRRKR